MRLSASSWRRLIAVAVTAPWLAWAVVRVLGLDVGHPLVAAISFTPYVAATAPLPVLVALALRRWVVAGVAGLAAVCLVAAVLPRAVDGPHVASADTRGPTLVVMTSNVYGGRGDAEAVVRLAREHRVDVLSLQELTPAALRRLDAAGARRLFPGRAVDARPGAAGSGLMARRRLRPAGPADRTAGASQPEAALTVPGAVGLRVKAIHPYPPISGRSEPAWRRRMRELPGPREGDALRVLIGDFNGTLDHREIRRLLDRGHFDAADATGDGLRGTWPAGRRRPQITIDHVLPAAGIRVRRVSVHEIGGSDHRAVIAELVLPRRRLG